MSAPRLIGLCGRKGSGKTTVAGLLNGYVRMSFAAPIKHMLRALGVTADELEAKETVLPRFGCTPRHLMQTLGTEWGRNLVHQNLWINLARHHAKEVLACGEGVVFDDVRFDNEAQLIREMGGVIWQVTRPQPACTDSHVSERGIRAEFITGFVDNISTETFMRSHLRHLLNSTSSK